MTSHRSWALSPGFFAASAGAIFAALTLSGDHAISPSLVSVAPVQNEGEAKSVTIKSVTAATDIAKAIAEFADAPLLAQGRLPPGARITVAQPESFVPEDLIAELPAPVEVFEVEPEPDLPPLLFLGFMRIGDETRALIRDDSTGIERWMREHDIIGQWSLVEMSQQAIIIEAKGIQKTIKRGANSLP